MTIPILLLLPGALVVALGGLIYALGDGKPLGLLLVVPLLVLIFAVAGQDKLRIQDETRSCLDSGGTPDRDGPRVYCRWPNDRKVNQP